MDKMAAFQSCFFFGGLRLYPKPHTAPFAGCIAEFISRFTIWSPLTCFIDIQHGEVSLPELLGAPTKDNKLGSSCTYKAQDAIPDSRWVTMAQKTSKNISTRCWSVDKSIRSTHFKFGKETHRRTIAKWAARSKHVATWNNIPVAAPEPLNLTHCSFATIWDKNGTPSFIILSFKLSIFLGGISDEIT